MGYMDFYSNDSLFKNNGKFSAIDSLYNSNYYYPEPFTLLFRGTIKNTGSFLIDKPRSSNSCERAEEGAIYNYGKFEITQGSNCNFTEGSGQSNFIQDDGELKVDGNFATHNTKINQGTITGSGSIVGLNYFIGDKVTLSPGSPIGTLSVAIAADSLPGFSNAPAVCFRCSIDIELAGASLNDRLQVTNNSSLILYQWTLNVLLREGYVPHQGDSFDIIMANAISEHSTPNYNLPKLPSGLNWDVYNNGTKITLSVN